MYISYYPDLAVPGAADTIRALTAQAVAADVQHLVLLSGRGEQEARACEQIVKDAGADWTLLRASWFSQNFSEGYLLEPVLAGDVALPAGDTPEPFVDVDDIADVAVAALTEVGHAGQLYELTGPRMLTFAEAVAEVAAASGREIRFTDMPREAYAAALTDAGLPGDVVGSSTTSSRRSSTGATLTSPTECSAPWAARPRTSATTRARPPPAVSGA